MGSFSVGSVINAPPAAVWRALARIEEIDRWNPGVVESYLLGDQAEGVGAQRHCDLGGNDFLRETVVRWEPERALTMQIASTNLPFRSADIHFELEPQGGATRVTLAPEYSLRFGVLGTLLDWIYVRRTYRDGMRALLAGLKTFVEEEQQ